MIIVDYQFFFFKYGVAQCVIRFFDTNQVIDY